jgi:hypothetical protein
VERLAGEPVPEPGAPYWDGFAAAVRDRLDRSAAAGGRRDAREDAPRRRLVAAAAACVLLSSAALSLWPPRGSSAPAAVTEAALDAALRKATRPGGPGVGALDMGAPFAEEPASEVAPAKVLEALRETEVPAGLMSLWDDAGLEELVHGLDVERSRRLVEELTRQRS